MIDTWVQIPGYQNYEANRFGAIRRIGKTKPLCPAKWNSGYLWVCPSHNGIAKPKSVHRLIAAAFIGPKPEMLEINHKNGDKLDNRPENLEYVTRSENIAHSYSLGNRKHTALRGDLVPNAILCEDDVRTIRRRLLAGERQTDIAKSYGVTKSAIWAIAHRKWWKWVE
jgi:hypothetical protein